MGKITEQQKLGLLNAVTPEQSAAAAARQEAFKKILDEEAIQRLWESADKYQKGICDSNFKNIIDSSILYSKLGGKKPITKAQACKDVLDSLWDKYSTRKEEISEDCHFECVGNMPYTFQEVLDEYNGL